MTQIPCYELTTKPILYLYLHCYDQRHLFSYMLFHSACHPLSDSPLTRLRAELGKMAKLLTC